MKVEKKSDKSRIAVNNTCTKAVIGRNCQLCQCRNMHKDFLILKKGKIKTQFLFEFFKAVEWHTKKKKKNNNNKINK